MATTALSISPSSPSADLTAFVNQHHRFPHLGDELAPWHYRGWLLAYVILMHSNCSAVADRWGYCLRTLDAGKLLDEPIPQIAFGTPDKHIASMLREWSAIIGHDCGGWSDFRTLLDWLSWGLALSKEEPHLSEQVNEKLYRNVDVGPFLETPYDYLGEFVAEGRAKGWNPMAFYPTPHFVVELIVRMTMADDLADGRDSRLRTVCDPCVGSGRMLLHASNISMNLLGQDIDPLAVVMCKINGALYAPWLSFPLPDSILGSPTSELSTVAAPIFHVNDRGQRLLFDM